MDDLVPLPDAGRRFTAERRVRLGDVTPAGRLRLDALARYLQDVAFDDGIDADVEGIERWVLRRLVVEVGGLPRFGEVVALTTWCSGVGARWAERRTSMTGDVEAAALWVFVDRAGRPARVPPPFFDVWGETAAGRKVSARLAHPAPPADAVAVPWSLRAADFDILGHVNNAAYWEPVEQLLTTPERATGRWEIEFRDEVGPATDVGVVVDGTSLWWTSGAGVHASVRAMLPG